MKKVFSVLFALVLMVFANNQASAKDVYIGTSSATGWDCYVDTDSIQINQRGDSGSLQDFDADLRMITPSKNVNYLHYNFWRRRMNDGGSAWFFENSAGFTGRVDSYDTPIEYNLWNYVYQNY